MGRFVRAAALAALVSAPVFAAGNIPTCGPGSLCPDSAPCCSAYGQCGVGAYCLGGCDPRFSHSLKACAPNPTCKSSDYQLKTLDDVTDISKYLGDNSKTNWVASGKPVIYNNEALLLTMAPDTVGTLLSSANYVWYGKVSATLTTSQGAGVVTAFILMSDSKDEIDFEWVGVDLQHVQSNYYAQGITNYNNAANLSASNTNTESHTYTIDWTPDQISWSVDGKELRVKKKSETWNSTGNRYDFPQTPARIMLSLWPAGLASNAKGTIDWAGGQIDWNSPAMKNGYYYAMFSDVKVDCYDPPAGARVEGKKSYEYTDTSATNQSIRVSDDFTILKSILASGEKPNDDPNGSASKSGSQASATPESIPGVSGIGNRGDTAAGSGQGNSGSGGGTSGFNQGTNKNSAASSTASTFALVLIVAACLVLGL